MEEPEFPSNNRASRERTTRPKDEPKKVEKVVTGKVVVQKKPLGRRFVDTFIRGHAKGAAQYVVLEILLPAFKDTLADMVSQGAERMIFGEARSSSRRTGLRPGGNQYVSYNRYSSSNDRPPFTGGRRVEESRPISRRARASHNFDEIVLATRAEAEEVIDQMYVLLNKYNEVTVADLYDLVGAEGEYTDEKWGWTDLQGSNAIRVSNGYLLGLPRPEQLP